MKTLLSRVKLDILADYNQFYVWDPDLPDIKAPEDYTDGDVANRIKIAPGVVVIQPIRNMAVPVEIQVWDSDPGFHFSEWQHIAEAPLHVTKGRIEIHECTGRSLAVLHSPAPACAVRALFKGLDSLSQDGLDGKDFYEVQVFPSGINELRIIKKWTE